MAHAEKGRRAQESTQVERFKEVAHTLGCDEDKAAFKAKLAVIAWRKLKDEPESPSTEEVT